MQSLSLPNSSNSYIQSHLDYFNRVNLGAYYTSLEYVSIVWEMVKPFVSKDAVVLDSSCGYGNFFKNPVKCRKIGNDIDSQAVLIAKQNNPEVEIFNLNALKNINRDSYNIGQNEKLIIIGNPPYNDTTSIIRSGTKKQVFEIDEDVISRDLGISFLLSYSKLKADYICVLHPLSYLVKQANFAALKEFTQFYRLEDGLIISSNVFSQASKSMQFPILIAFYKRGQGMNYDYIKNFLFKTSEGTAFSITSWKFIRDYINKYPAKNYLPKEDDLFFYTMRDLNALKRNQTFIPKYGSNSIIIDKSKLDYYVYVDVVKDFSKNFPYYLGNFDVLINLKLFNSYREYFICYGINKYSFLKKYYSIQEYKNINSKECSEKISEYFKLLLGEHYVAN